MNMDKSFKNTALLIIDAQKGFTKSVFDVEEALANIKNVLTAARESGLPIIHSQEIHRREMVDFGRELDGFEDVHCIEGSEDAEIVESLRPIEGEYLITKRRYSCFFSTDLNILLNGLNVKTLIVCGFLTDVCVHYTCADAHQHDYYVKVLYDCVRGSSKDAHDASLKAIKYLQSGSELYSEDLVNELNQISLIQK